MSIKKKKKHFAAKLVTTTKNDRYVVDHDQFTGLRMAWLRTACAWTGRRVTREVTVNGPYILPKSCTGLVTNGTVDPARTPRKKDGHGTLETLDRHGPGPLLQRRH